MGNAIVKLVKKVKKLEGLHLLQQGTASGENKGRYKPNTLKHPKLSQSTLVKIKGKKRSEMLLCSVKKPQEDKGTDIQEEAILGRSNKIGFLTKRRGV
ncbi:hypothetical protein Tco_1020135 [Tanacetum coccineum]|uniref:Uncharacterized protein n=1 Tax=Tanacetum coccineum TaxID=301880 RepID=A0ABQ5G0K8_9ASTR